MLTLHHIPFNAMATECCLHLYANNSSHVESIADLAIAEILRIEARYSRYRSDSILSELNRAAQSDVCIEVDEETSGLLDYAYACYQKSNGLFDITSGVLRKAWDFSESQLPSQAKLDQLLPLIGLDKVYWQSPCLTFPIAGMELDFGGIGKEYAADRAAEVCVSLGVEHGLVDLGGDIVVIGPHPNHEPWQIGIRNPASPDMAIITVEIDRGALATSGNYERFIDIDGKRYCHLLNPKTGWPSLDLSSVSVFADQCLVAGSLSSIAMLKGRSGIDWLNELRVPHLSIDSEGSLSSSL